MSQQRITLAGSARKPVPNGQRITGAKQKPDPGDFIEVTVSLRRKQHMPAAVAHAGLLTREQLAANHGATAMDLLAVGSFAEEHCLKVVEENAAALTVKIAGTIEHMEQAFGVCLNNVCVDKHTYRERTGPIKLPGDVARTIEGVFGLDNRPAAQPRFQLAPRTACAFSPLDVARLYNFPGGNGEGQVIAIIALGGGFNIHDLNTYFAGLGLVGPRVTAIPVPGGTNLPTGDPGGADGEVMLDIEVAGAVAPGAEIKVYFAPNTDKGFLDAVNAAIHDSHTPTVLSISWGGPEESWTVQTCLAFDKAFQNAAALSIPVTVASGDSGSADGTNTVTVDFPASSPYVLACGGTHLEGGAAITKEVVWNASGGSPGGGVSNIFRRPAYQGAARIPAPLLKNGGRGVPDVCGNASVETGYRVRIDGTDTVVGGTSAVAPLWAGLIARMAQNLGRRVPFLNPVLYANPKVLKDITTGNNDTGNGSGRYRAAAGWDACTGLGSPDGNALLKTLRIKLGPIPQNQDTMIKNRSITRSADGTGITGTTGLTGTTGTTGTTGMTDNTGNTGEASYFHNQLPRAIAPNAIGQDYGHSLQGENFNAHSHAGDANNEVAAKAAPAGSGINNGAATGFVYGMCCHCDPGIVAMVAMVSNVAATAITAITGIAAGNGRK